MWSFLRFGPETWSVLGRVFVFVLCLVLLACGVLFVLWVIGFRLEVGPVNIGPAPAPVVREAVEEVKSTLV
jgi:hypothetical protein